MRKAVRRSTLPRLVMWRGRLTARYIQRWQKDIDLKTYRKIKPHSSKESEDKVLMEKDIMMKMMNMYIISSWREHLQEADDGMGDGVGRLGCNSLFFIYFFIFLCMLHQEVWEIFQIFQ